MNNLAQKVIKHKNSVHIHPRVLVKNNKNILVLKNKHGKEQHFYVIEQNELDRQSARKLKTLPYESIVSNIDHDFMNVPTVKSTDYQDVKNYKFSSVQNLFNLKREDKFLDGIKVLKIKYSFRPRLLFLISRYFNSKFLLVNYLKSFK